MLSLLLAAAAAVTVTIRCDCPELRAGDEISIVFTVTNTGSEPITYDHRTYDRSGRMSEFQLTATRAGAALPDPRSLVQRGYIGGGLSSERALKPGESVSIAIALNLWALITEPGEYEVRGRWVPPNRPAVDADPIRIRVLPRSSEEMRQYIAALASELRSSMPRPPARVIQRLMYTTDPRAADVLRPINAGDNNTRFWIEYAFAYYLRK